MKKNRKQRKHASQQKNAINYLSLISERETGYLQDWTKINQIKQQDFQSSNQQAQQNKQQQIIENPQKKKHPINFRIASQKRPSTNEKIPHERINSCSRKSFEVKVQNFASIPHRKTFMKISKVTIQQLRRYQNQLQVQAPIQNKINNQPDLQEKQEKMINYPDRLKMIESASMTSIAYMQKIRKLSLPWLKSLPKAPKNEDINAQKQTKQREQARRLSQIIKNKIRRKHSNKFLLQKKPPQLQPSGQVCPSPSPSPVSPHDKQSNQIKLLKSWLDNNRSKRKRSISSLLTQHFENKYQQKKKQRQKTLALRSVKILSTLGHGDQYKMH